MSTMFRKRQAGFSIVAAVFILVVLAGLGGFVVTVSTAQHTGAALDVQGARAYQAARGGAEWGAYAVRPHGGTDLGFRKDCKTKPAKINTTLNGFTVTILCDSAVYTDGNTFYVYRIQSTACPLGAAECPNTSAVGSLAYVERSVSITVTDE